MAAENSRLPELRQDLAIIDGGASWSGAPTFLVLDRLSNRYFRIGLPVLEILGHWRGETAAELSALLSRKLGRAVDPAEIRTVSDFLTGNGLCELPVEGGWKSLFAQQTASRRSSWKRLLHSYLFFRIPLLRPQGFIDAFWPVVRFAFTSSFALVLAGLALLAILMVSRQWETFMATFTGFMDSEGFMMFATSLVLIKAVHEFGHALMARKYGIEVPVIGIAFMVLMPILYTDTTGAHRLKSRLERLNIDLGGVYAELALAVVATLLWIFLPDGPMRSIAFTTATLSWVTSLAVNLNPFMRFDGYYVLSDMAGLENLQERGFALARWQLRETLFGLGEPAPEVLPANTRRWVILHAWGTWIYRFFLFLGIALLVYAYFTKVVGIILFAVEILWFILLPVSRELKEWWIRRATIFSSRRAWITGILASAMLICLLVPWSGSVEVPAVLRLGKARPLHPLLAGQVVEHHLASGERIERNALLLRMHSPQITESRHRAMLRISLLEERLARQTADQLDRSMRVVLENELASVAQELAGLERTIADLEVRAPFSGYLADVDPDIAPGMWLNPSRSLALLLPLMNAETIGLELRGLVEEQGSRRLPPHAIGVFYPDEFELDPLPVELVRLQQVAASVISEASLAMQYGGRVPSAHQPQTGELQPMGAWFPVLMRLRAHPDQEAVYSRTITGLAILQGERQSFADRIARRVAMVLVREFSI